MTETLTTERPFRTFLRDHYGLIQIVVLLAVLMTAIELYNPRFLSPINISNLLGQMVVTLVVAIGMTVVIIAGEIDISVGAVVGLTGACSGWLLVLAPTVFPESFGALPAWLQIGIGVLLPLLVGVLIGLCSGLLTTSLEIPSFIVTLGMMMIARSLSLVVTRGQPIAGIPDAVKGIGVWRPISIPIPGADSPLTVPFIFLIAVVLYWFGWFLMERTAFGKKVYAVGANPKVARLAGINVEQVKIRCFMIVGLSASVAGMLNMARIGAVSPTTGTGLEFEVIAAVVIGGTSLAGGRGRILRTILGVLTIVLIRNFLNLARIEIFWQDFATGVIILAAVLLNSLQGRIARRI